jgi:hypothetical protein
MLAAAAQAGLVAAQPQLAHRAVLAAAELVAGLKTLTWPLRAAQILAAVVVEQVVMELHRLLALLVVLALL